MSQLLEELRGALWTVWNRRWLALAVAWGVCLLGWLVVALIPNSYESNARIFVQLDDVLAQQIGIGSSNRKKDIDRVRQTLTSSVNLEKVVRSTLLGDDVTTPSDMERAVVRLGEDVSIRAEGESLFEISAASGRSDLSDSENAQLAQSVAQRMIDIFREENLGGARGEMRETLDFLDQQLASRQVELEGAEQRRLTFESQYPELIGGPAAIASKLGAARSELRGIDSDLAAAQSALAAINGQIAGTPRTLATGGGGGPRASLAQAQSNMTAMRARGLTDAHPDIVSLQKQIAALTQQVRAAGGPTGSPNPAYSALVSMRVERQANVHSLAARSAAMGAEIGSISANQAQEPGIAAEATRISRDYEVLRQQYDKLLKDREELRLRGQVETERSAIKFEVIDPPSTPRKPAAPNRPLLLFGVLIIGLGAGAAVAFALGKLGSTYSTSSQLERAFGLPVIGTISNTVTQAGRVLRNRQLKFFAAAAGGLAVLFVVLMSVEFVQRGLVA